MKIFLAGASFSPSYGGTAFAVSRLALALADVGASIGIWAPDGSAVDSPLVVSHFSIHRLAGRADVALKRFGRPDILHDNGIWLPGNHKLARLARQRQLPRVVSLHGMLQPWAMNNKKCKKQLAWRIYQRRDLESAQCHHATAEAEARSLRSYRLGVPIRVVHIGVDIPDIQFDQEEANTQKCDAKARRIALFLGRIHPVKGLPMLIEAWSKVRPEGWVLHLAGPDEEGHRAEVEARVRAACLSESVSFLGPVGSDQKLPVYRTAELLVLPSHSENFGMVVGEALAHGIPVLTTRGTPWPMLPEQRCGWWVDATVEGIIEGLREATLCDPHLLKQMGGRGRAMIAQDFSWKKIAAQFLAVYQEMLSM